MRCLRYADSVDKRLKLQKNLRVLRPLIRNVSVEGGNDFVEHPSVTGNRTAPDARIDRTDMSLYISCGETESI